MVRFERVTFTYPGAARPVPLALRRAARRAAFEAPVSFGTG